jgi:aminodeoxyfutalosine deaminase
VTINTDDPAMFATNLGREMLLAARHFELTADEIIRLAENAIRGAFVPEAMQKTLLAELSRAAESTQTTCAGR